MHLCDENFSKSHANYDFIFLVGSHNLCIVLSLWINIWMHLLMYTSIIQDPLPLPPYSLSSFNHNCLVWCDFPGLIGRGGQNLESMENF